LFSPINVGKRLAAAENWFKPQIQGIDRTKAVNQHLLEESFL